MTQRDVTHVIFNETAVIGRIQTAPLPRSLLTKPPALLITLDTLDPSTSIPLLRPHLFVNHNVQTQRFSSLVLLEFLPPCSFWRFTWRYPIRFCHFPLPSPSTTPRGFWLHPSQLNTSTCRACSRVFHFTTFVWHVGIQSCLSRKALSRVPSRKKSPHHKMGSDSRQSENVRAMHHIITIDLLPFRLDSRMTGGFTPSGTSLFQPTLVPFLSEESAILATVASLCVEWRESSSVLVASSIPWVSTAILVSRPDSCRNLQLARCMVSCDIASQPFLRAHC